MADGIAGIVQKYTGKPISLSYTTINGKSWGEEFYTLFQQIISRSTRIKLEDDLKKLPNLSIQELLLGSETATYDQAVFAISIELGELIVHSRDKYSRLRHARMLPEVAFKDSMNDIEELIQAIQSGEITEDFYLMVKRQLNEKRWSYCGEFWERK